MRFRSELVVLTEVAVIEVGAMVVIIVKMLVIITIKY